MNALTDPRFWAALDRRITRLARQVGQPLRATLEQVDGLLGRIRTRAGQAEDEVFDAVEVAQHYGFASRPGDLEVVTVSIGGSHSHRVVIAELDRVGRPELEQDEVTIYSSSGASVLLTKDGDVVVTPAAGRSVLLAGGGAAVARVGDEVSPSAGMTTWLTAAAAALQSLAAVPLPSSTAYVITEGSDRVEAG